MVAMARVSLWEDVALRIWIEAWAGGRMRAWGGVLWEGIAAVAVRNVMRASRLIERLMMDLWP